MAVPQSSSPEAPSGSAPNRPYTLSPGDSGWLIEDVWPPLYFGRERVGEVRRKVQRLNWARAAVKQMESEAEVVLRSAPQLPIEQCGWRHDFYSRRTGAHLKYEPNRSDLFLDPTTGHREADAEQRRAWALLTHERTFRIMRGVGFLYQLTGKERYARWVAEGLRQACDYFTHTEFHRQGALYFQSLYDAAAVALLANIYGLVRHSAALSSEDHERIRRDIFEERLPSIATFAGRGPANMDCFVAVALATAGEVFDRQDWQREAANERLRLASQLDRAVPSKGPGGDFDGFWAEGTTFYHLYSLCALIGVREKEHELRGGIHPDAARRLTAMLDAPIKLTDQRFRLPTLGDLGDPLVMTLCAYRHVYEYAAGRIDQERYGPLLAALYQQSGAPRTDLAALAYGPDELPSPERPPDRSTHLAQAGIGIFRTNSCWLLFRSGPYRAGHDHPDRLSVALSIEGQPISPDPGTPGYSLHGITSGWFRSTLAHNTLFVDDQDQFMGGSLDWRPAATPPRARGMVEADGVVLSRTVLFSPPFFGLIDEFLADRDHIFGWAYHAYGRLRLDRPEPSKDSGSPLPPPPYEGQWRRLTERRYGIASDLVEASWDVCEGLSLDLRTTVDEPKPLQVIAGRGLLQPFQIPAGTLVYRRHGRHLRLRTVLRVRSTKRSVSGWPAADWWEQGDE